MDTELLRESSKTRILITGINLFLLLFLFRTAIPEFKYPFLLLCPFIFIYVIYQYRASFFSYLKDFFSTYRIAFVLLSYMVIAFILSGKLYVIVFKEILNAFIVISIFYILYFLVRKKSTLGYYYQNLLNQIIIFGFFISLYGTMQVLGIVITLNSNLIDYNFALLPSIFATVAILSRYSKINSGLQRIFYSCVLISSSLNIFLSGSRRGLIVVSILAISLILIRIFNKKPFVFRHLSEFASRKLLVPVSVFFSVPILSIIVIAYTSGEMKDKTLKFLGTTNISMAKMKISENLYRNFSLVNRKITSQQFYDKLWEPVFDSRNPDSGWGQRIHKKVYNLKGDNSWIVPNGAIGYKMDNSCDFSTWGGNTHSFSVVKTITTEENDGVASSVYCYASEDFNGSSISIQNAGSSENKSAYYDLRKKGTWQKLSVVSKCKEGVTQIYLYFSKYNSSDFSELTGEVIFACPEAELLRGKFIFNPYDPGSGWGSRISTPVYPLTGKNVSIVPDGSIGYMMDRTCNTDPKDTWNGNTYSYSLLAQIVTDTMDIVEASVYCYVSEDFDGSGAQISSEPVLESGVYDMSRKGTWQHLNIRVRGGGLTNVNLIFYKLGVNNFSDLNGYVIFAHPEYKKVNNKTMTHSNSAPRYGDNLFHVDYASLFPLSFNRIKPGSDWIRNLISEFFKEDTSYYATTQDFVPVEIINDFSSARTARWNLSMQIYIHEYNLVQKIAGGGFSFLNWFGHYFYNDKLKKDWPHNPFLSILLYSGLTGLCLYLYLLFRIIILYLKAFKDYGLAFIFFLLTFFFAFFSSGNPFDPPVMAFLVFLPFFINKIIDTDDNEKK